MQDVFDQAAQQKTDIFDQAAQSAAPKSANQQDADFAGEVGKSIYQVSAPGIATSILQQKAPRVAAMLPDVMTRNATPLNKLPGQVMTTGGPMMVGDEVPPEAREPAPQTAPSEPGVISRVAKVGIKHIPGYGLINDVVDAIKGPAPEPPPPQIAKPPIGAEMPVQQAYRGLGKGLTSGTNSDALANIPQKPVYPGASLPAHPGEFPGASLPAKPPPEVFQAKGLAEGGKVAPPRPSDALGKIPVKTPVEPKPVFPGANLPAKPPVEVFQARGLTEGAKPAPPQPSEALGRIPVRAPIQVPKVDTSPKAVEGQINDSLGGKPLKPNVPLREQMPNAPKGISVPKESSVIKDYKYDPATKEMTVTTQDGGTYIHGEVTPEQAEKFQNSPSKGKAWAELKNNSTPVAKVVNGQRVGRIPPKSLASATPESQPPDIKAPAARLGIKASNHPPEDLTALLKKSVELARKGKGIQPK